MTQDYNALASAFERMTPLVLAEPRIKGTQQKRNVSKAKLQLRSEMSLNDGGVLTECVTISHAS